MKQRFFHIDVVRAIGTLGIIATHVVWNTNRDPLHFFVWNYLHFVVVAFVICSGYVIGARGLRPFTRFQDIFSLYSKRFLRLVLPMYVYLAAHYALWFAFPQWFTGGGILQKNIPYVAKSLALIGGLDISWLTLLFVQFTVLLPLFLWLFRRPKLLGMYILLAIGVTTFFTMNPAAHAYYRWVMWIPWSLIFLLGLFLGNKEQLDTTKVQSLQRYLVIGGVSAALFMFLSWTHGAQIVLTNHKYPPDWYYLSYAAMMTSLLLIISRISLFDFGPLKNIFLYISSHSYTLFFVFFIVLDFAGVLAKQVSILSGSFVQFVLVTGVSLGVCLLLDRISKMGYTARR